MPALQSTKKVKYQELANEWRKLILEGAVAPGSQLPSFSEMYAQYGATQTTVERVYALLAQEGLIVREHRRGVFVANRESNKVKNGTIGFLFHGVPDLRWPYWRDLMEGIQQEAKLNNMQILLINDVASVKWEQLDGVVIGETWQEVNDGMIAEIWEGGIPGRIPLGVPCSAVLSQIGGVRSIIVDDYQAAFEMTRYLLEKGHKRIAYLSAVLDPISKRRIEGYRDALKTAGIEPDAAWVRRVQVGGNPEEHYIGGGRNTMLQWMAEDWFELGCTAMLTQNDDTAIGVIQALRKKGLDAPADLSVAGFDGAGVDKFFTPQLATVVIPLKEIGINAVKIVMQQMSSDSGIPSTLMLPARIRDGASVRALGNS